MARLITTLSAIGAVALIAACEAPPTTPLQRSSAPPASMNVGGGGTCTLANGKVVPTGFDQYGYNRCAHQFVGTFGGWCAQQGADSSCGGVPGDTRLVMKWTQDWDLGNAQGWSQGPYNTAWLDNEINGDGFSEHFKTKWSQYCVDHPEFPSYDGSNGSPCIWGQFLVLMDQGTDGHTHVWWAKLSPAGFGG